MRRIFSAVFLILGAMVLLGTPALVLGSLDKPAALIFTSGDAAACVEELTDALSQGDFAAAEGRIYGLSDAQNVWEPADDASALIWQAYLDSIECTAAADGYTTQTGMAWDVTVSTLDISEVAAAASERAKAILEEEAARNAHILSDPQKTALLREAARQAIAKETGSIVRDIQLNLIRTNGAWYVLPDEQLLLILSGNLEE